MENSSEGATRREVMKVAAAALAFSGGTGKAFTVDTAPGACGGQHLLWCSLNFGATYCSCGVDIAWEPIYELG